MQQMVQTKLQGAVFVYSELSSQMAIITDEDIG